MYYNDEQYTVTGIGDRTFMQCHALESVDIPASIVFMHRDAFFYCKSLKKVIIREDIKIPLFKGVFNRTNLSDIYWYGNIKELNFFLDAMVSNESSYHPDYNAITIHISKNSDADTDGNKWRFRNYENYIEVKFKIVKDI